MTTISVTSGHTSSGLSVSGGTIVEVFSGGTIVNTTLAGSGTEDVLDGTGSNTTLRSGAVEADLASAFGTIVSSGGEQDVYTSALASGTTVSNGGLQDPRRKRRRDNGAQRRPFVRRRDPLRHRAG